jgi:hypothetical protein
MGKGWIYWGGAVKNMNTKKDSNWMIYCEVRTANDARILSDKDIFAKDYHIHIHLNERYSFEKVKRLVRDYKPKLDCDLIRTANVLPIIEKMIMQKKRRFGRPLEEIAVA